MASTNLKFIVLVADSLQAMKDKKTLVHEEKFQDFSDFSANAFRVTIGRCQQVALDKAGGKLPLPAEQLALINKHREKKNARLATAKPISIDVLVWFWFGLFICFMMMFE